MCASIHEEIKIIQKFIFDMCLGLIRKYSRILRNKNINLKPEEAFKGELSDNTFSISCKNIRLKNIR